MNKTLLVLALTVTHQSADAVTPEDFLRDKPSRTSQATRSSNATGERSSGDGFPIDVNVGSALNFGGQNVYDKDIIEGVTPAEGEVLVLGDTFGFWGGLEYKVPTTGLSVGANLGYQFKSIEGTSAGNVSVSRIPLEGLFYYRPIDELRLGLGGNIMLGNTLTTEAGTETANEIAFDTAYGFLLDASYHLYITNDLYASLGARYNLIGYTLGGLSLADANAQNKLVNGSYIGINFSINY